MNWPLTRVVGWCGESLRQRLGWGLLTLAALVLFAACGITGDGSGGGGDGRSGSVDPVQTTQVLSGELSRWNQLVLPLAQADVPVPPIPLPGFSPQGLGSPDGPGIAGGFSLQAIWGIGTGVAFRWMLVTTGGAPIRAVPGGSL